MCSGEDTIKTYSEWMKNWSFSAVDTEGLSGGLLSGWSSDFKALSSSSTLSSILVNLKHKDYDFSFSAINIYGPYSDRVQFWENLKSAGVFNDPLMVIGGDLNFTLSLREVWGSNPREDRHKGFFLSFLEAESLVDLEPVKLSPTWRNFRMGIDVVAKRLDLLPYL
jgi:hypothetical protein